MDNDDRVNVLSLDDNDDQELLDDEPLWTHNTTFINLTSAASSQTNSSHWREPEGNQPLKGKRVHVHDNNWDLRNDITHMGAADLTRDGLQKDLREDTFQTEGINHHTDSSQDLRGEIKRIYSSRSRPFTEAAHTPPYGHDLRNDILALTESIRGNTSASYEKTVSQHHSADKSQDHSTVENAPGHYWISANTDRSSDTGDTARLNAMPADTSPTDQSNTSSDSTFLQHTTSAANDMSKEVKQSTERYFVMRFRSKNELEEAQQKNLWPTNPVYDKTLQQAFETSGVVYLVFTINFTKKFCGIARMTSEISWFPERTIFDRSRFQRRMQLQWLGSGNIPYDYITDQLHLPRYMAIHRHGGELGIEMGQLIRDLILKQDPAASAYDLGHDMVGMD
ncbi:hypothetical protein BGX27_005646 [Mortierella sp. AM989]|nr:hypothetical protein BGX27_005646 [Mortierella sp. AM989]